MKIPMSISRHLRELMVTESHPCLLRLAPDYRVIAMTGDAERYGLAGLGNQDDARDRVPLLHGIPLSEPVEWPMVEIHDGVHADVLIRPMAAGGAHILLTDAAREHGQRQIAQQHANETALLNRQLRRALAELESAKVALEQKNRELESLNQAKTRFIASLSHELRTPLTAILGHATLLQGASQSVQPSRLEDSIKAINMAGEHLLSLVNNVLDQACMETGQLVMNPTPTDLSDLFADLSAMLRPMAEQRGLAFRLGCPAQLPAWVETDATRLRQVIINLMMNAIKYTPTGFVGLTVQWEDARLRLWISDSGPGIPQNQRARILLPFERGESTQGQSGVGLGLAISVQLVRLLGGTLTLDGRPGGGSVFQFEIPAPALGVAPAQDPGVNCTEPDTRGRQSVLLVDDAAEIRLLYASLLEMAGHRVCLAEDSASALSQLGVHRPEVVIVDMHLGSEDGVALIQRLRADGFAGVIIGWSASAMRDDRSRPLVAGADAYLVKPVPPAVLHETLRALTSGA